MRRERRIDGVTWLVAAGLTWLTCPAHAGEVVVTGTEATLGSQKVTVQGNITGFSIRKFKLRQADLPAATCPNVVLGAPACDYELVIKTPDGGEGEQQNPNPPPGTECSIHTGVQYWLNGVMLGSLPEEWGQGGTLTYRVEFKARLGDSQLYAEDYFTIKSVYIDKVEGPYGICKGDTATFTVTTTPEDGVEYVTGSCDGGSVTRQGNTFTVQGDTPGDFVVRFQVLNCQTREWYSLKVIEVKDIQPTSVCSGAATALSATVTPAMALTWAIVGEAPGWTLSGNVLRAGAGANGSVTVKAEVSGYGCSTTATIGAQPASVKITDLPTGFYALKGSTKTVEGEPIKLKAELECYAEGGKFKWVVDDGSVPGDFGRITDDEGNPLADPDGLDQSVNDGEYGTSKAQEIIFRAWGAGAAKVKVRYTVNGQTFESAPVEFKAYQGQLKMTCQPDPAVVRYDQPIAYSVRFTADPGTPDDPEDDKDWGPKPVMWTITKPTGETATVTEQSTYQLDDAWPGTYQVVASLKINPTFQASRTGVKDLVIEAELVDKPPDGATFASGLDPNSIVLKLNEKQVGPEMSDIMEEGKCVGKHLRYRPKNDELKHGTNTVEIRAKDGAGNPTNPDPYTWTFELP